MITVQPAGRLEVLERPARRRRSPVAPALRCPVSRRYPAKVDDSSSDGHVSFSLVLCSFTFLFLDFGPLSPSQLGFSRSGCEPLSGCFPAPLSATENVAQSRTVRIPASHPPGKGSHRLTPRLRFTACHDRRVPRRRLRADVRHPSRAWSRWFRGRLSG